MIFFEAMNVMSHWKMFDGKNGHQFVELVFIRCHCTHFYNTTSTSGKQSLFKGIHGNFAGDDMETNGFSKTEMAGT